MPSVIPIRWTKATATDSLEPPVAFPSPRNSLQKKFAIRDREIPGILYHQAASEPAAFPESARMLSPTGSGVFITECCGPENSAAIIFLTGYRL